MTDDIDHVGYKNPYRYRGYRYDSETGLYYLQSRYYNPEWGRYINADTTLGGVNDILGRNMFAYCNNNPVNFSDPDGKFLPLLGAVIISGVIGAAISAGTTALMGAATGTFNWTDVGIAAATGFVAGALMPVVGTTLFGATVLNVGSSMSQYIWSKKAHKQPIKKSELAVAAGAALVLGVRGGKYTKPLSGFNPSTHYMSNAGLPMARQSGLVQMEQHEVLIGAIAQSATRRNIINGIISNGGIDLTKNVINYISERISIFKDPEDDSQQ